MSLVQLIRPQSCTLCTAGIPCCRENEVKMKTALSVSAVVLLVGLAAVARANECPSLEPIENGLIFYNTEVNSDSDTFESGTLATYYCNPGYFLGESEGDQVRACMEGNWTGTPPACVFADLVYCFGLSGDLACGGLLINITDGVTCCQSVDAGGLGGGGYVINGVGDCISCATSVTVGFDPPTYMTDEGGVVNFRVTLVGDTIGPVSVMFTTEDGSATKPDDYTLVERTLTFNPGTTEIFVSVQTEQDDVAEQDEMFFGRLSLSPDQLRVSLVVSEATAMIFDDDAICDDVMVPENGVVTYTPDTIPRLLDTVANFSCNQGYLLNGQERRVCVLVNGTALFDLESPTCDPICAELPAISNGAISYDASLPFDAGTVASHTCDSGFLLVGAQTRTCIDSGDGTGGRFNGEQPVCEFDATAILVGFDPPSYMADEGDVVNFRVTLTGDTTVPVSVEFITVEGSATKTSDYTLVERTLTFNPGATEIFVSVQTEQDDVAEQDEMFFGRLSLSPDQPQVSLGVSEATAIIFDDDATCADVMAPENGVVTYTPDTIPRLLDTVANFSCNQGYLLNGQERRVCVLVNGTALFDLESPTCDPIECEELPPLVNGMIMYAEDMTPNFELETVATYQCNEGFFLSGVDERNCTAGDGTSLIGVWTDQPPICIPNQCGELPEIENGVITYLPESVNDGFAVATYSCNPGYSLVGDNVRFCQNDSMFSGNEPSCQQFVIGLEPVSQEIEESQGYVELCASLTTTIPESIRIPVTITTVDGTAVQPDDYSQLIRAPLFANVNTRVCFNITIETDNVYENTEQFSVQMFSFTELEGVVVSPQRANITILDSTAVTIGFIGVPYRSIEDMQIVFRVGVAGDTVLDDGDIVVNFSTADGLVQGQIAEAGSDYQAISDLQLTFNTTTSVIDIPVDLVDDGELEVQESFRGLLNLISGERVTVSPNVANASILDSSTIVCQELEPLMNGRIKYNPGSVGVNIFQEGTEATYNCDPGLELVGDAIRVCQNDSQFDGQAPSCQRFGLVFCYSTQFFGCFGIPSAQMASGSDCCAGGFLAFTTPGFDDCNMCIDNAICHMSSGCGDGPFDESQAQTQEDCCNNGGRSYQNIDFQCVECFEGCFTDLGCGGDRVAVNTSLSPTEQIRECCLQTPALSYNFRDQCVDCLAFGFLESSLSGTERGPGYTIEIGYIKRPPSVNQVFRGMIEATSGSATSGEDFSLNSNIYTARPNAPGEILVRFQVDNVAQEEVETVQLQLNILAGITLPPDLIIRDTMTLEIIDDDIVVFQFTENDYRFAEDAGTIDAVISKNFRIANPVTFQVFPYTVQQAEEDLRLDLSDLNVPPDDNMYSPNRAQIDRDDRPPDFDNSILTVTFEADEDLVNPVNDMPVPIPISDDDIDETQEEVFIINMQLGSAISQAGLQIDRASSLCRINDNDVIQIGFQSNSYTFPEPESLQEHMIFLEKQDRGRSEQTYVVVIQASQATPGPNIDNALPFDGVNNNDYTIVLGSTADTSRLTFFPDNQTLEFNFFLFGDQIAEGLEAFQVSSAADEDPLIPAFSAPDDGVLFPTAFINIDSPSDFQGCFTDLGCGGDRVAVNTSLSPTEQIRECCLQTPALSYNFRDQCVDCLAFGFLESSLSGTERGPGYTIEIGYIKRPPSVNQVFRGMIESTSGSATSGEDFSLNSNIYTARPNTPGEILVRFQVDNIAQEEVETAQLQLNILAGITLPPGLIIRDTMTLEIIDDDIVVFQFTENDYRFAEDAGTIDAVISKNFRIANPVTFQVFPYTIQQAEEDLRLDLSDLNVPPDDNMYSPNRAQIDRDDRPPDFDNSILTVTFEADEDLVNPVNDVPVPIPISDDDIDEALEEVFIINMQLGSAINQAGLQIDRASSLCRINDNDVIQIGFQSNSYTFPEPESLQEHMIFLEKQDRGRSEQTYVVVIQASQATPGPNIGNALPFDGVNSNDYTIVLGSTADTSRLTFFPDNQTLEFNFFLFGDQIAEGLEAFQVSSATDEDPLIPAFSAPDDGVLFPTAFINIDSPSDLPRVGFEQQNFTVPEDIGSVEVCFRVLFPPDNVPLTINIDFVVDSVEGTADEMDYTPIRSSAFDVFETLSADRRRACFNVTINADNVYEDTEQFSLMLNVDQFVPPTVRDVVNIEPSVINVNIIDVTQVVIGFGIVSDPMDVNEVAGPAIFQVEVLEGIISDGIEFQVQFFTRDGTAIADDDYVSLIRDLTFSSTSTVQQVSVTINEDDIFEGFETFTGNLRLLGNPERVTVAPDVANVRIVDEDIVCRELELLMNGRIEYVPDSVDQNGLFDLFEEGTEATHICNPGFVLVGDTIRVCQNDSEFSGQAPTCQPIECEELLPLMNGMIFYAEDMTPNFELETVATYQCNEGFFLSGVDERNCTAGDGTSLIGVWTDQPPICIPIECPELEPLVNGDITYAPDDVAPFDLGTVATYECDEGFYLNVTMGSEMRTCVDDNGMDTTGEWTDLPPTCVPVQCLELEPIMNGFITYASDMVPNFDLGTVATYACNPGFVLDLSVGSERRTCEDDNDNDELGIWTNVAPTCIRQVLTADCFNNQFFSCFGGVAETMPSGEACCDAGFLAYSETGADQCNACINNGICHMSSGCGDGPFDESQAQTQEDCCNNGGRSFQNFDGLCQECFQGCFTDLGCGGDRVAVNTSLSPTEQIRECCLQTPALSYNFRDQCVDCLAFGFLESSLSGTERGPGYTIEIGYIKSPPSVNQVFRGMIEATSGSATSGEDFSLNSNIYTARPNAPGEILVRFLVDNVAQEDVETAQLQLNILAGITLPPGLIIRDTMTLEIIDDDIVVFQFTENDYRFAEDAGTIDAVISKNLRIANPVTFQVFPYTVQQAEEDLRLDLSDLNVPPDDNMYSPNRAQIDRDDRPPDFDNSILTVTFEADEDLVIPVNDVPVPIPISDDDIDEALEEVFIINMQLGLAINQTGLQIDRASSLCRINDNDVIQIGFQSNSYTFPEPGRLQEHMIFLEKQDRGRSEQTYVVVIQASQATPGPNIGNALPFDGVNNNDYTIVLGSTADTSRLTLFPDNQTLEFNFFLFGDQIAEGLEAFQVSSAADEDPLIPAFSAPSPGVLFPTAFIIIDGAPTVVGLQETVYSVDEDEGSLEVCAEIVSGQLARDLEVAFTSADLTAMARTDFGSVSQTLTFMDTNDVVCVNITIVSDTFYEIDETFTVTLTTEDDQASVQPDLEVATVTIVDDDELVIGFDPDMYSVSEDGGSVELCARILNGDLALEREVIVNATTSMADPSIYDSPATAGDDFDQVAVQLIFDRDNTRLCFMVMINQDDITEGTEVVIANVVTDAPRVTLDPDTAVVSILEPDQVIVGFDNSVYSFDEGSETGSVTIVKQGSTEFDFDIRVSGGPSDQSDIVINADGIESTLTFPADQQSITISFDITNDDLGLEDIERYIAMLEIIGNTIGVRLGEREVEVQVVDDDVVSVGFGVDSVTVLEFSGQFMMCVRLDRLAAVDVEVDIESIEETATAGVDYDPDSIPSQVTIAAGTNETCFTGPILDDDVPVEGPESFMLRIVAVRPFDASVSQGSTEVTILDTSDPFCEALVPIPNGVISYSFSEEEVFGMMFEDGTVATYSCNNGYVLEGASMRTCVVLEGAAEGEFDGVAPQCVPICRELPAITNGQISYAPDMDAPFSVGTVATYSCNEGYELVLNPGDEMRTCMERGSGMIGQFDGVAPTCEPFCLALQDIENGVITYSTDMDAPYSVGTVATYECEEGYNLVGSDTRICQSNGTFSGTEPTCVISGATCDRLSGIPNGQISYAPDMEEPYDLGTVATYSCDPGFELVTNPGDAMRTCVNASDGSGGRFNGSEPFCEPVCDQLLAIDNGVISYSPDMMAPYSVGTVATYMCNEGFQFELGVGDQMRTCEELGNDFSGSIPRCIECVLPLFTFDSMCTAECPPSTVGNHDTGLCETLPDDFAVVTNETLYNFTVQTDTPIASNVLTLTIYINHDTIGTPQNISLDLSDLLDGILDDLFTFDNGQSVKQYIGLPENYMFDPENNVGFFQESIFLNGQIPSELLVDGEAVFPLQLRAVADGRDRRSMVLVPMFATVTDPGIIVEFEVPSLTVSEGDLAASLVIVKSVTETNIRVTVLLESETAEGGDDFGPFPAPTVRLVAFLPASSTRVFFGVPLTNDPIVESLETFRATLEPLTEGVTIGPQSSMNISIMDDDFVEFILTLRNDSSVIAEGNQQLTFNLMKVGEAVRDVNVVIVTRDNTTTDGSDYVVPSRFRQLSFAPSDTELTFTVTILQDNLVEQGMETFIVTFEPADGETGVRPGTVSSVEITIQDDSDFVTVRFPTEPLVVMEGDEGLVGVVSSGNNEIPINVTLAISDISTAQIGLDYSLNGTTLTFEPGVTLISVPVVANSDGLYENEESLILIGRPADGETRVVVEGQGDVMILNTDSVSVGFSVAEQTVSEASTFLNVTVQLTSGELATNLVVTVNAQADLAELGDDFLFEPVLLTFAPDGPDSLTFDVTIRDDIVFEGRESFRLSLTSLNDRVVFEPPATQEVLIVDNEDLVILFSSDVYTVEEIDSYLEVFLELGPEIQLQRPINLVLRTSDGEQPGGATGGLDYTPIDFTLTFGPEETNAEFNVSLLDDEISEGLETFSLNVIIVDEVLGDPGVLSSVQVRILDDEDILVSLSRSEYTVREGEQFVVIEIIKSGITPNNEDTQVTLTLTDGTAQGGTTDYGPFPLSTPTISLPAFLQAQDTQTVFGVEITDDRLVEGLENFTIDLSLFDPRPREEGGIVFLGNVTMATVTIEDNDVVNMSLVLAGAEDGQLTVLEGRVQLNFSVVRNDDVVLVRDGLIIIARVSPSGEEFILEFGPGVEIQEFSVNLTENSVATGDETLTVQLFSSDPNVMISLDGEVVVNVIDNDFAVVEFERSAYETFESEQPLVEVCLTKSADTSFSFTVAVIPMETALVDLPDGVFPARVGVDFDGTPLNVTFDPTDTRVCASVRIFEDDMPGEGLEGFMLGLRTPDDTTALREGAVNTTTVFIDDLPDAIVGFHVSDAVRVREDVGEVELCVGVLNPASDESFNTTLSLNISTVPMTADVTDFVPIPLGSLIIILNDTLRSDCFSVQILNDDTIEEPSPEEFRIQIEQFTSSNRVDFGRILILPSSVIMQIDDEDDQRVTIGFVESLYIVREDQGPLEVCVAVMMLEMFREQDIGILVTTVPGTADESDYGALEDVFVGSLSNTNRQTCFSVAIMEDGLIESNETLSLTLAVQVPEDSELLVSIDPSITLILIVDQLGPTPRPPNITANDSVVGDPLFSVPLNLVNGSELLALSTLLHLCYEIHGRPNTIFNLVSDTCTNINALYTGLVPDTDTSLGLNVITEIGVRAQDSIGNCIRVLVDVANCTPVVYTNMGVASEMRYSQNGVVVSKMRNRVRISVPNCDTNRLVMWVTCQAGGMLRFDLTRGIGLTPTSHGLLGQFWNIPISISKYMYTGTDELYLDPDRLYAVSAHHPGTGSTRHFIAEYDEQVWDLSNKDCLYAGNIQGGDLGDINDPELSGSVIQGSYSQYIVNGIFDHDFMYSQFNAGQCLV